MSLQETLSHIQRSLDELAGAANKPPLAKKAFLTVKHAAAYSDLSEESLRRLCESGKLTALRPVSGRILIDRQELEAYIRTCVGTPRKGRGRHEQN